ncbi:MAG: translation initiation factor IF-3 [Spirochaetales bacterium]|nr:translation initiation factor IF-3 [Spirochaetales bacterium]MCF7937552.1 translation initiation factor IF-3 [Spirochaetales bacterium]
MATKELRINDRIRVPEIRLIDEKGEQRGIVPTKEALQAAMDLDLDLVEVAPQAKPPVCKLLDYGKYKFEQEKKLRESKKKQQLVKLKEVRMQPKIEKHDLEFKTKHILDFLHQGSKVKVTIRFRGREMAHTEIGRNVLLKILDILGEDEYNLDSPPKMEGRFMSMLLSPKSKKGKKEKDSDKESKPKNE